MPPTDQQLVSPWLLTTQCHEHIACYDVSKLHALIAIKKNENGYMSRVSAAVLDYFNEAIALLPATDELILKRLNSKDPQKQ